MPRRVRVSLLAVGLVPTILSAPAGADQESPRIQEVRRFVQGLRDRNFHDLVPTYAESLRRSGELSAADAVVVAFEEALSLLDQAGTQNDLGRRATLLEEARARLDSFQKDHPDHPLAAEATLAAARALVERGHLAALLALDARDASALRARQGEARAAYDQARAAYGQALDRFRSAYESFPKFLPERDPRRDARETAQRALLQAELLRALVDYKDAQTHAIEPGEKGAVEKPSPERARRLDLAASQFEDIYHRHREQLAGLSARKMQGKCLEEKGEFNKAMGIYKELMDHPDPNLKAFKQEVAYFELIVKNRRKEHAAAAAEATAWLRANPGNKASAERLGVMLEKGRALLAMRPAIGREQERDALDSLNEVAKYLTPLRPEAMRLLAQNRPRPDRPAPIPTNITYDAAMDQADRAAKAQDWDRAIALAKAAVRAADPTKDPDKANDARHLLASCYFQTDRYYEAAIAAEHIARHYPKHAKAAQAAELALVSWSYAYSNYTQGDRRPDLDRLLDLARFIQGAYPGTEQEQAARMALGRTAAAEGRYGEAAEAYEGVPSGSPRFIEAHGGAGWARWRLGQQLRAEGKNAEADEQARKAQSLLEKALQARKDQNATPTDPGLLGNVSDLAEVMLATDQVPAALALLDPVVKSAAAANPSDDSLSAFNRLVSVQLRAHIAAGETEAALEDMKTLEKAGGQGVSLTQLYYSLGRLLQRELDSLKNKGDKARYDQTQQAYVKFLEALAGSKTGQSQESLQWAGESLLAQGQVERATRIFEGILEKYGEDTAFKESPGGETKLLRTRLKLIAARRARRDDAGFQQALQEAEALIKQHPRALEPLMERCKTYEEWAELDKAPKRWDDAIAYWRQLATVLNKSRSPDQFEAWYHVAYAQSRKGAKQDAVRTLKGVLALSPNLDGPETRKKYDDLLKQLNR